MGSPKKDSAMRSLTNGSEAPHRTVAEMAREKKLRDDPMAEVHGPLFVTCKRCGGRIKLSPKSSYDPFHWTKHRERCLRKPVGVARAARRTPKEIYTSSSKKSPTSSSNTDGDNATPPPLTPDDDRPGISDVFKERSPSPNIDDIDLSSKTVNFPIVERWQTWNWSELRPPAWITDNESAPAAEDQDEYEDEYDETLPDPMEERYPAPKLTLHQSMRAEDTPPSLPT